MSRKAPRQRRTVAPERVDALLEQAGQMLIGGRELGEGLRTQLDRILRDLDTGAYSSVLVEGETEELSQRINRALSATPYPRPVTQTDLSVGSTGELAQPESGVPWPESLPTPREVSNAWRLAVLDRENTAAIGEGFNIGIYAGLLSATAATAIYLPVHAIRTFANWRYGQVGQFFRGQTSTQK